MKRSTETLEGLFQKKSTLTYLNNIVKKVQADDISDEVLKDLEEETAYIGKKLGISPIQCVILGGIIEAAGPSSYASDDEIRNFLGVTNIEYMNFEKDIEQLSTKYIVRIESCSNGKGNRYTVYGKAMEAISSNEVYHPQSNDGLTPDEVFTRFRILFSEYFDDALTEKRLNEEIVDIIERNHLKVSLIQSSAVTISVCVDNTRYVAQALQQLAEDFRVTYNENLSLLTIRGTSPEILEQESRNRTILLRQLTRRTARLVIQNVDN